MLLRFAVFALVCGVAFSQGPTASPPPPIPSPSPAPECNAVAYSEGYPQRIEAVMNEWDATYKFTAQYPRTCGGFRADYVGGTKNSSFSGEKRTMQLAFCVNTQCPDEFCDSTSSTMYEIDYDAPHTGLVITDAFIPKGSVGWAGLFIASNGGLLDGMIDLSFETIDCDNPPLPPVKSCDGSSPAPFVLGTFPFTLEADKTIAPAWNVYDIVSEESLICPTLELRYSSGDASGAIPSFDVTICTTTSICPEACPESWLVKGTLTSTTPLQLKASRIYAGNGFVGIKVTTTNTVNGVIDASLRETPCTPPGPSTSPTPTPVGPSGVPTPVSPVPTPAKPSGDSKPSSTPSGERPSKKSHKKAAIIGVTLTFIFIIVGVVFTVFVLRNKKQQEHSNYAAMSYAPMTDPSHD